MMILVALNTTAAEAEGRQRLLDLPFRLARYMLKLGRSVGWTGIMLHVFVKTKK